MTNTYLWALPPVRSLPVRGRAERAPVNRLFFVGRNYHAHAVEMGRPVDKSVEVPFYFTKSPDTLVESGATVAYPPQTSNYHYEMELVLVIGKPGFRVPQSEAASGIYGYACGLDMTRATCSSSPATRAGRGTWARTSRRARWSPRSWPCPASCWTAARSSSRSTARRSSSPTSTG